MSNTGTLKIVPADEWSPKAYSWEVNDGEGNMLAGDIHHNFDDAISSMNAAMIFYTE